MNDGHPYLTEALDLKRAEQRRRLRSIPDWLLDRYRFGPAPSVKVEGIADPGYAETLVRKMADEQLATLSPVLGLWEAATDAERLADFVANEVTDDPERTLRNARADLVQTVFTRRQDSPVPKDVPEEYLGPLAQAALLLSWADELADDDYTDPRLSRARQS